MRDIKLARALPVKDRSMGDGEMEDRTMGIQQSATWRSAGTLFECWQCGEAIDSPAFAKVSPSERVCDMCRQYGPGAGSSEPGGLDGMDGRRGRHIASPRTLELSDITGPSEGRWRSS